MATALPTLTVRVEAHARILVSGVETAMWRVRLLGCVARLLGVPLELREGAITVRQSGD
jgi:hypothetical protein